MHANVSVLVVYYAISIVVAVVLWRLLRRLRQPFARACIRAAMIAFLFTPWLFITEGVAVVPASLIVVLGGYEIGLDEALWGLAPIGVVFLILSIIFIIGYRCLGCRDDEFKSFHETDT